MFLTHRIGSEAKGVRRSTQKAKVNAIPKINLPDLSITRESAFFYAGQLEELPPSFASYTSPHRHDYYAVFYFVSGSGSHEIDFENFAIEPGSIFLLRPGQVHSWHLHGAFTGYALKISREFCSVISDSADLASDFPLFAHGAPVAKLSPGENAGRIRDDFHRLVSEYRNGTDARFWFALAWVLLFEIDRLPRPEILPTPRPAAEFLRLLDENISREHSAFFYAGALGLPVHRLNRICQNYLGGSAGKVIRERLLLEIQRLLLHSTLSVQEIARELGFADPSYFSRFVRKNCGASPEALRRSVQKVL